MIHWLLPGEPFPPVEAAMRTPAGLLAAGGDLSTDRLIDAYRHGIFPWFDKDDPILWWCTDPRMVLYVDEFKVSHSLGKRLVRSIDDPAIAIRCDTAFEQVIRACARPRGLDGGTWIVEEMIDAYLALHRIGVAHSVETWIDGSLVGGLYGVAIGRMFYGESMFTRVSDASKMALAHLVAFAKSQAMPMLDCQQQTNHLASMGARPIPRREFSSAIADLVARPAIAAWPGTLTWSRDWLRDSPHDTHTQATTHPDGNPA